MRSFLLLGVFLAPVWIAQAQQSPKAVQTSVAVAAAAEPLAAKFNPDPQDYLQISMFIPSWVEAAPGCKVFVSDYVQGVMVKWQGAVKDGKGHGKGRWTRHNAAGNLIGTVEGELQQGVWQGGVRMTVGDVTMDAHMQDGYMEGPIQISSPQGISFQGQMVANVICGLGRRVHPDGTTEEGFFLDGELLRGKIAYADGQVAYREEGNAVEALSPEKPYTPALGVQLVEYLDKAGYLCDRAEAHYYRVVTYKAPFRPQGMVRDYYMDGTLQSEFTAPYLDSRYLAHMYYEGLRKDYSTQGMLLREYAYALEKRHGMSTDYWPNGRKKEQVAYLFRQGQQGPFRQWSETGYLLVDANYDMGVLTSGSRLEYDEAGRCTRAHLVNFQQDRANWQRQDGEGLSEVYDPYGVTITSEQGATALRFTPVKLSLPGQEKDYTVMVRMVLAQAGRYGLLLGAQDKDNYISFELDGAGKARVCRTEGGRTKELKPWTSFPAVASGQELYTLKVVCQQGQWHFFCQGQELFALPAEKLKAYGFGLLAQGALDAANLEVRESLDFQNTYQAPLPAAKPLEAVPWPKWAQAGPGCEVFEPRFRAGMTLKWEGPVQQGKAHGQGRLTCYVDGQQEYLFEGSCQQGIPAGKGKRTDANGRIWEGDFIDGLPHGQQHIVWPDAQEYRGQVFGGVIQGEGKFSYADGTVLQGFMVNGNLHTGQATTPQGERTYYYKTDQVEQLPAVGKRKPYTPALGVPVVEYLDSLGNRCDKAQASYYREVTYKAPFMPQGKVRDYFISGKLESEYQALYLDADDITRMLYQGERKNYYENGQVSQQSVYDRGLLHGKLITYTAEGKPLTEQYWQQGNAHGQHRTWDEENGRLLSQVSYINGVETDYWEMIYEEDGSAQKHWNTIDDFSGDISAWSMSGEASREGEQLLLQGQAGKQSWILRDVSLTQQEQYGIYGRVGLKEPRAGVSYGLLLGYVDADNHCELLVRHQGKHGEVAFFCTRDGVRRMLMPWKQVQLQAQSQLFIFYRNGQMGFLIDNGTPTELPLTPLAGHRFGACLYGEGVLQLDEFGVLEYVTVQPEQ